MSILTRKAVYGINWALAIFGLAIVYASFSGIFQSPPAQTALTPIQEKPKSVSVTPQEQPKTNSTFSEERPEAKVPAVLTPAPLPEPSQTMIPEETSTTAQATVAAARTPNERPTIQIKGPKETKRVQFNGFQYLHPGYAVPPISPSAFPDGF